MFVFLFANFSQHTLIPSQARVRELKMELLNSEKFKSHFEENPKDLAFLKHDQPLQQSKQQLHLKAVPSYLIKTSNPVTTVLPAVPESKPKFKRDPKQAKRKFKRTDPLKTFSSGNEVRSLLFLFFFLPLTCPFRSLPKRDKKD